METEFGGRVALVTAAAGAGIGKAIARRLAAGLAWGGLNGAGWAVSGAMAAYFGWFFWKLATWSVDESSQPAPVGP